jgi:hypothetical protein
VHVRGHDHRPQRPIHPPAGLEQRGEERAGLDLGDPQLHITGRRRQGPVAAAVALVGARVGALVPLGADRAGQLGLDQLLQRLLEQPAEHRLGVGIGDDLSEHVGKWGIIVVGHRVASPRASSWFELAESHTVARPISGTSPLLPPLPGTPTIAEQPMDW